MTITPENIEKIIDSLKEKIKIGESSGHTLIMPASIPGEIDRTKYKGKGRPRNTDYKRIPFPDYLSCNED